MQYNLRDIVFSIIIAALVAGFGVYFWLDDTTKEKTDINNYPAVTETSSEPVVNNDCESRSGKVYFKIPELGVKVLVDESVKDDLIYEYFSSAQGEYIIISSDALIARGECEIKLGGLFALSKEKAEVLEVDGMERSDLRKIDDYYITVSRQEACSMNNPEMERDLYIKSAVSILRNQDCIKEL